MRCEECIVNNERTFLYIDGDLIVVVLFPIHDKSASAMGCSGMRKNVGLDVALSAQFALEEINKEFSVYKGKKFGMLLLDSCNDPLITTERVLDIHMNDRLKDIEDNVRSRIVGYVGGLGSSITMAVADITTKFKLPYVSNAT